MVKILENDIKITKVGSGGIEILFILPTCFMYYFAIYMLAIFDTRIFLKDAKLALIAFSFITELSEGLKWTEMGPEWQDQGI